MKFSSISNAFIAFFLLVILAAGCSFDSPSEQTSITTKPVNPLPADNSANQSMSLTLSWESSNASNFDVYLDTQNPPQHLLASNVAAKNVNTGILNANTRYYWKVVAKNDAGSVEGDVWSFTTGSSINPGQSGYVLVNHRIETVKPCFVNMIYQVLDFNGNGIGTLTSNDFELIEDGFPVSVSESDLTINKKTDVFDTLKVVVMLDNSTSLAPNINQIRLAASQLVYNLANSTIDGVKLNVQVAIYTFSENVVMLTDFITDKDRLYGVVYDRYALGQATTDLYGAVLTGASRWTDVMTSDKIREGVMILFTDGSDTQGSHSLGDALTAVENKHVFTVGLGNEIDPYILGRFGTSGYYQISDISQLTDQFNQIQKSILNYINSFYVLKYKSPKRGNFDHLLHLDIKNNPNTGTASFIEGVYNSFGFSSN